MIISKDYILLDIDIIKHVEIEEMQFCDRKESVRRTAVIPAVLCKLGHHFLKLGHLAPK